MIDLILIIIALIVTVTIAILFILQVRIKGGNFVDHFMVFAAGALSGMFINLLMKAL